MGWSVRNSVATLPPPSYVLNKSLFSIELHHGGIFRWGADTQYDGGKVSFIDNCVASKLTYLDLVAMGIAVGCPTVKKIYCKSCGSTLSTDSLIEINYDNESAGLSNYISENRHVEVYLDSISYVFGDINSSSGDDSDDEDYVGEEAELESLHCSDDKLGMNDDDDLIPEKNVGTSRQKHVRDVEENLGIDMVNEGYVSCDDLNSDCDSDEENCVVPQKHKNFNRVDFVNVQFKIGMMFSTYKELQLAVKEYAIQQGKDIRYERNASDRMILHCEETCPWYMYASKIPGEKTMQIKTLIDMHDCSRALKNRGAKPSFIAYKYLDQIKRNPTWDVMAFRGTLAFDFQCDISFSTAAKAFEIALQQIEGSSAEQYKLLWDYIGEIKKRNPCTTAVMKVEANAGGNGESMFKRLYICWGGLKRGFIEGCRPLIGLDGCHLTGPHKGVLLAVVAIDANNCMFPFAYAVVDIEKYSTWKWFLKLIRSDLSIIRAWDYIIMSDKQKGLIKAVEKVFPMVGHMFCVRHLYNNFKTQHKGLVLKDLLWKAARAATKTHFIKALDEMKALDNAAYDWLSTKPGENWSRSHFDFKPKCDLLLNNLCESFNAAIKVARGKPILSMLETIRLYLMSLVMRKHATMMRYDGQICPKVIKKLDETRKYVNGWQVRYNGNTQFEVDDQFHKYQCDIQKKMCGCNKWQLSGIPCAHGVASIQHMGRDHVTYIHECYNKETYLKTYSNFLMPINGRELWEKTNGVEVIPLLVVVKKGKPKKARTKDVNEAKEDAEKKKYKLSRKGIKIRCTKCKKEGHNSRRCGKVQVTKVYKYKAWEKKKQAQEPTIPPGDTSSSDESEDDQVRINEQLDENLFEDSVGVNEDCVGFNEQVNEQANLFQVNVERVGVDEMLARRSEEISENEQVNEDTVGVNEQVNLFEVNVERVGVDEMLAGRNEEISENDTWLRAMRNDGMGLPQYNSGFAMDFCNENEVSVQEHFRTNVKAGKKACDTIVKGCGSPKRKKNTSKRQEPVQSCPSPKRNKNTKPHANTTPVRRSSRIRDAPRKGPQKDPIHIDLTNDEEIPTQESVARHGGTFKPIIEQETQVCSSGILHAGTMKPMEKQLPTGQYLRKCVLYVSREALKAKLQKDLAAKRVQPQVEKEGKTV